MKNHFIAVSLMLVILLGTGCRSSMNLPYDTGLEGSSFEEAIPVKSVAEEYEWIRLHYPDHIFVMQSLVFEKKKPYDILTIEAPDGAQREIYFNISRFYGKIF